MISRKVRERLAQDVALWQVDGLVSPDAAAVLRQRYDVRGFGLATLVRYFGVIGAIFVGFGILGALAAAAGSLALGAIELLAIAAGFLFWGLKLAADPLGRSVQSSRALLAIGVIALAAAGGAASAAANAGAGVSILIVGLTSVPVAFALAYRFQNGFLLVLGLLGLFHWLGSWHSMIGRSTYAFDIQDPRLMAVVAGGAALVGFEQRRGTFPGPAAFATVLMAVGLLYANVSLLILTVDGQGLDAMWIVVWALAAIVQIVAGATIKSAVPVGFGATALAVNMFTRYFESFWGSMPRSLFFLAGGTLLFGFGVLCEWLARRSGFARQEAGR
jgi:hypothetical protein